MNNKYLNADPVPWLTDGSEPAATYLAKKEFCPAFNHDDIYHELELSELTVYFKKNSSRGILGNINYPDLINKGTIWFFLMAVEYGYDFRSAFIQDTASFITENFLTEDGGFSLALKPRIALACRTGDLVRSLIKAGIKNEATESGLEWIVSHQRMDGGWLHCPFKGLCDVMKLFLLKKPGSGINRENDKSIQSCPVATLSCVRALSASSNAAYKPAIENGLKYLMNSSILAADEQVLYCGLSLYPQKAGYPLMSQFDSITALIEIINARMWIDSICSNVFNTIMKKQTENGRWKAENNSRGMNSSSKKECRMVTLNALRLVESVVKNES